MLPGNLPKPEAQPQPGPTPPASQSAPAQQAATQGARQPEQPRVLGTIGPVPSVPEQQAAAADVPPAPPKEAPAAPPPGSAEALLGFKVPPKKKAESKVAAFFAGLNNIGMGKECAMFIQNLAMLLNAGLTLIDALKTLVLETRSKPMKKAIVRITDAVESGAALWQAMDDQHLFSPYAIALTRIGEEAGNLARNMEYLAVQQEKDGELRGKVKMAMIYPSVVIVLMFIMVMGLGIFILPNLVSVLFALNAKLPITTRWLIAFSNFFSNHSVVAVSSSCGVIIGFLLLNMLAPVKRVTQWVIFRIPGIGRLAKEATIARFGVILGGLLKAGVPLVEAMRSLTDVTTVLAYKTFYKRLTDDVNQGQTFRQSFEEIHVTKSLVPQSVQSLIVVGERSGSLADVLMKIADIYDKKASETAQKLPIILEPMLLLFIGGLVAFIAISIIVPIYSVVGQMGVQP